MQRTGKSLMELAESMAGKPDMLVKSDAEWQSFYNNKFISVEKAVYGDDKNPHYRFQWVLKKAGNGVGKKCLDVGCSTGLLSKMMQRAGFLPSGIDVSAEAVKYAKDYIGEGEFKVAFADQHIPFEDNSFDVVTCLEVFEHVKDLPHMVSEILRVCKPGGMILVTTPIGTNYNCPEHVRYFDFYTLFDVFDPICKDFKISRIYKIGPQEGERKLWAVEVTKDD